MGQVQFGLIVPEDALDPTRRHHYVEDVNRLITSVKRHYEQIIEQMQPFVELGVDYFMLDCGGFPRLTTHEMLMTKVLPALHR